jgi:hypothetical protein
MVNTTAFLDLVKEDVKDYIIANSTYLAVGSNDTAETVADTTLNTEELRKARQEYYEGTSDVVVSMFVSSLEENGTDLEEVGVFNAAAAGDMMTRITFPTIAKTSGVEVWIDVEQQVDVTQ